MSELIDFSYARFTPAEVRAAGLAGVIRYVTSGRPQVSATRSEVDAIRAAGLAFVAVWQRGADRALAGRTAGAADALDARAYCAMLGAAATDPVHFAVDVDTTTPVQIDAVLAYFQGAASVLGWDRVGVYGEADVLDYLAARTPMRLYWQTASWSAGRLSAHATLHQYGVNRTLLGRAVDFNRSVQGYYGQWGEVVGVAAWRVARALSRLREQCDAAWPARSTISDGTIGNDEHATRSSDHNPWYGPGVVTAVDITHDPAHGADMHRLAAALMASRDRRIKYCIWNHRSFSGATGRDPDWTWRPYDGPNPHTKHLHVSVAAAPLCDDTAPWRLPAATTPPEAPVTPAEIDAIAAKTAGRVLAGLGPTATRVVHIDTMLSSNLTKLLAVADLVAAGETRDVQRTAAVLGAIAALPTGGLTDEQAEAQAVRIAAILREAGVPIDTDAVVHALGTALLDEPAVTE